MEVTIGRSPRNFRWTQPSSGLTQTCGSSPPDTDLIHSGDSILPYAATFSSGSPDTIGSATECVQWWELLSTQFRDTRTSTNYSPSWRP